VLSRQSSIPPLVSICSICCVHSVYLGLINATGTISDAAKAAKAPVRRRLCVCLCLFVCKRLCVYIFFADGTRITRFVCACGRTLTIAISDGVMPGSDGRNYVVRRILRRGVRYAKQYLYPAGTQVCLTLLSGCWNMSAACFHFDVTCLEVSTMVPISQQYMLKLLRNAHTFLPVFEVA
jgi:hypothetical protein